ncbi:MAG TPA: hypothetical protein VN763_06030 [Saprospiraceae bacterium]|nr:hypothetical protein [Saprospiraceae bacterium]HZV43207.1 hypothetical protein [Saprospiraceae bacterium]
MKKTSNSSNRRKFLSLGLLGGAGLLSQKATAMLPIEPEAEKIQMLTPDGKLVEVDKRVLDQVAEKKKAANTDILDWTTTQYKTEK